MDFRRLKYFLAVAGELNFGRAATRLHISQPPLSRQIQLLEAEIGVALFRRTPKGVELTEAGIHFVEEARNMITLAERATERTLQAGLGKFGRIDVAVFGSGIFDLIPKLLLTFRRRYPDVKTVLHSMDRDLQLAALRDKRITVGFNRFFPGTPDIDVETVLRDKVVVALHRSNPLARHKAIRLRDLAEHPMILFPSSPRPGFMDFLIELCLSEGFRPKVAQETDDVVTCIALVSGGFGVSLVTESTMNLKLPGVVYRPIKKSPAPFVELSCLYRKNDQSPILRAFLEVVREFRK